MDDRVRRLRARLEALSGGRAPRGVRYPVEIRAEVVGLAREAHGAGIGARVLAKQLGLPLATLTRWGRPVPRQRLRRITIAPARAALMAAPSAPVLVTPQGWRVEGLDVATLLRVLQLGT
jgi:hypothetical protein